MSYETPQSAIVAAGVAATLQLFRFAFDLIATASQKAKVEESQVENKKKTDEQSTETRRSSVMFFNGRFSVKKGRPDNFASTNVDEKKDVETNGVEVPVLQHESETEQQVLTSQQRWLIYASTALYCVLFVYFLVACILTDDHIAG